MANHDPPHLILARRLGMISVAVAVIFLVNGVAGLALRIGVVLLVRTPEGQPVVSFWHLDWMTSPSILPLGFMNYFNIMSLLMILVGIIAIPILHAGVRYPRDPRATGPLLLKALYVLVAWWVIFGVGFLYAWFMSLREVADAPEFLRLFFRVGGAIGTVIFVGVGVVLTVMLARAVRRNSEAIAAA